VKRLGLLATGLLLLDLEVASAQQLEPRAYSPSPAGLNFVGLPYTYQTGSNDQGRSGEAGALPNARSPRTGLFTR